VWTWRHLAAETGTSKIRKGGFRVAQVASEAYALGPGSEEDEEEKGEEEEE
jgi:hypothetical protein